MAKRFTKKGRPILSRHCRYCQKYVPRNNIRFCSGKCYYLWRRGKPRSPESVEKTRMALLGRKRPKEVMERVVRTKQLKGIKPWNLGKRGLQIAWNKGLTKDKDERVKKYSMNLSKPLVTKICLVCGEEFSVWPYRVDTAFYCSKNCLNKSNIRIRKIAISAGFHPNKAELALDSVIQEVLPDQFKYVGDGSLLIEGTIPDWVSTISSKMVIELFGEPWHKREEENQRIALYSAYGYRTLIVWAKELCDKVSLKEKLKKFGEMEWVKLS